VAVPLCHNEGFLLKGYPEEIYRVFFLVSQISIGPAPRPSCAVRRVSLRFNYRWRKIDKRSHWWRQTIALMIYFIQS